MSSPTMLAAIVAAVLAIALVKRLSSLNKKLPYPPGPKPLPLLGNIRDIPPVSPWIAYTEWGRTYGQFRGYIPSIRFLFNYCYSRF